MQTLGLLQSSGELCPDSGAHQSGAFRPQALLAFSGQWFHSKFSYQKLSVLLWVFPMPVSPGGEPTTCTGLSRARPLSPTLSSPGPLHFLELGSSVKSSSCQKEFYQSFGLVLLCGPATEATRGKKERENKMGRLSLHRLQR